MAAGLIRGVGSVTDVDIPDDESFLWVARSVDALDVLRAAHFGDPLPSEYVVMRKRIEERDPLRDPFRWLL